jgi:tetratricopeptide (TPR) repeat protein
MTSSDHPKTPRPTFTPLDGMEITESAIGHWLSSQSPEGVVKGVAEDVVQHLILQGISYLLPSGKAAAHYRQGLQCFEARRLDEAIANFAESSRIDPKNIFPIFHRARAYSSKGDYDQAIRDYTAVLAIEPSFLYAYQNRALSQWSRGDLTAADEDISRARTLATEPEEFSLLLAIRCEMHRDYPAAIEAYTDFQNMRPGNTYTLARRAICHRALKQDDRAVEDYTTLIGIEPKSPYAYKLRGRVFLDSGRYQEAIADYRNAIAFDPENALSHYCLGRSLVGVSSFAEALPSLQRAVDLDPTMNAARWQLGVAYAKLGRLEEAIHAYKDYQAHNDDVEWNARAQRQIDALATP